MPDKSQANGAAQLQGVIADGNWKITAQLDLIANSQITQMPRGAGHGHSDVGNFLFTGENGPVIAKGRPSQRRAGQPDHAGLHPPRRVGRFAIK